MDDGKEGQTAADGHSDLQVEAGGRVWGVQVGCADSLPSENTKYHSPLPSLLRGLSLLEMVPGGLAAAFHR